MIDDAIGGYFELEVCKRSSLHQLAIPLNTARNAFEYVLLTKKYKKIYLPYFTCEVMLEPVLKLKIDYEFYSIDKQLEPIFDFSLILDSEAFLYVNYFGLKEAYIENTASKIKNIIIDNAQAFYSKPILGIDTFYSARKYVGVADGAYLYTDEKLSRTLDTDKSFDRMGHLLKRLDTCAEEAYAIFSQNDNCLVGQPIMMMSKLTQRILTSIDYSLIKQQRQANFNFLHSILKETNLFGICEVGNQVPMVYPYWSKDIQLKKRLQENRIYCATYWPNVKDWCLSESLENQLVEEVIYLPIDQRYSEKEMTLIINIIQSKYEYKR